MGDDVQRVGLVTLAEQHVAAAERPFGCIGGDALEGLLVDLGEQQGRTEKRREQGGVIHGRGPH